MTEDKPTPKRTEAAEGFTAEEKAAMQERSRELKAQRKKKSAEADGEADLLAKVAELPDADRAMAERIHEIIRSSAPGLAPRTWYGQPAYAREGKVVCFFQAPAKFKTRYATLGFNEDAQLDDGAMWPTAFAITELTPAVEAEIAALVKRAAG